MSFPLLKQLGRKEAPVIIREGLSKDQKAALRISDNRFSDFGLWDEPRLVKEWGSLSDDLKGLTGWSENQIEQIKGRLDFESEAEKEGAPREWDGETGANPNLFSIELAFSSKEKLDSFRKFINQACKKAKTSFQGDALEAALLNEL